MDDTPPSADPAKPSAALWHWWLPGLFALLALLVDFNPLQRLELQAFDLLSPIATTAQRTRQASEAVIVAIDDRSLRQLGRWPWPRHHHARLLEQLQAKPPKAVAFAISFDQPDLLDAAGDTAFTNAIRAFGRVVLPVMPALRDNGASLHAATPSRELANSGAVLGHVDVEIDPDGVLRRLYLRAGIGFGQWSALALAAREVRQPQAVAALPGLHADVQSTRNPGIWRRDAEILLRLDRKQTIEQLSFADVLNNPALAAQLHDRTVFVGVTAAGIGTAFSTSASPRGGLTPAVEFHARAFEALRAGTTITPLNRPSIGLITVLIIGIALLTHRRYERDGWPEQLLVLSLPLTASIALLLFSQLWYPPVVATLALLFSYSLWAAARFRFTRRDLFNTRGRAMATLNAVADGVISVDGDGRVDLVNPVAAMLLQRDAVLLRGEPLDSLLADLSMPKNAVRDALRHCLAKRETVHVGESIRLGGERGPIVRVVISPLPAPGGQAAGAVLALTDISAVVLAGEQLRHQATHDALTNLPNRTLLRDLIKSGLIRARRSGTSVGVLFLDLDDFKRINDSFSHHMGDQVLCAVASRLKSACRDSDTVGRWGGDEFVVVLPDLPSADAIEPVARKLLAVLREPLIIDGTSFHVAGTLGISHGPDDADDADHLLGMADTAMYRIKQAGGGGYGYASAEMSLLSRQRMDIENGLRAALQHGELAVFYQPQVNIETGALHGMEALIRWNRPEHGLVLPGLFIPVAEESDLILQLGAWVLDQVARQIRQWLDAGLEIVPVAVNVSARQCQGDQLIEVVASALKNNAISGQWLELEITETAAMANQEHVELLLARFKALGVSVALDDFGTGYSSLSHLRRFPISVLKIDQSFIAEALQDADAAAIISAIIALAHQLGLKVIGEGVETAAQFDFLATHGCDIAQGYHCGHPSSGEAMRERLIRGRVAGSPNG